MKKIFILTLSLIILSAASLSAAKHRVVYKIMSGSVKTVTPGDPSMGTMAYVTVVNDKSAENNFFVKPTTTLWNKDYKAINLDKVKPKDRIKIRYTVSKEGMDEAVSINILK